VKLFLPLSPSPPLPIKFLRRYKITEDTAMPFPYPKIIMNPCGIYFVIVSIGGGY
jgi:hypothetical protein